MRSSIPNSPGVYLHKNDRGEIIYIGKAKNLKKRVASYFSTRDHDPKTRLLVKNIEATDFIATNNEVEALLLENRLIKKHKPKYNIQLKESQRYHYIRITSEDFPRILIARKTNKKDKFFGPYTTSMFDVVKLIRKLFHFRACNPGRHTRPCLYYQIGMCSGPCGGKITKDEYQHNVQESIKFLKHGDEELYNKFTDLMYKASKKQEYEKALEYKNKLHLLDRLRQRQVVDLVGGRDQDAIGIATVGDKSCVTVIKIKKGVILQKHNYIFMATDSLLDEFLKAYYTTHPAPSEILLEGSFDQSISEYLSTHWSKKVDIIKPSRGKKSDLVSLAQKNAYLEFNLEDATLIELKELLRLDELPQVIDCFDISNYGESVIVGACVQYKNKKPNKSAWRHYNVQGDFGQDDFRSMKEVIRRRYSKEELPDLIIIDGGILQVNFAIKALDELGLVCPIVGLAKKEETIIFPEGDSLKLNRKLDSSKLIIRMRDDVHKFAISHSRKVFRKTYKKSELDDIPGIGDTTKFKLLREFGSLSAIKKASLEELYDKVGKHRGKIVYEFFNKNSN